MKRKVIIDTDPGHDDAIAIMSLLAEPDKIEIIGIVTVAGNQTIDRVTVNMLKIAELTECDIPIAMGETKPLQRKLETGAEAHGESGMDGPILPEPTLKPVSVGGVEFLNEKISGSEDKVSILALGPLTNIARLFLKYPAVKDKISEISLMGGGLEKGNITKAAEFNIYVDPEAAEIVFKSGIPITMSGLDVTDKAQIFPEEWDVLRERGKASRFVADLLKFYSKYSKLFGYTGSALHDACAAVWLLAPDLFVGEMYHVSIETQGEITRGMTVADKRRIPKNPPNVNVLLDVDRKAFIDLVLDNISRLDRMIDSGKI